MIAYLFTPPVSALPVYNMLAQLLDTILTGPRGQQCSVRLYRLILRA